MYIFFTGAAADGELHWLRAHRGIGGESLSTQHGAGKRIAAAGKKKVRIRVSINPNPLLSKEL